MTAMHWLWLGAIALMLLSLAVLLPPLLTETTSVPAERDEVKLRRLYQAQLAELEQERQGSRLSETDHAQAMEELQRRLLNELERPKRSAAWRQSAWVKRGSALALAVLLPVAAFGLYLQVGDPQAAARLTQAQPDAHSGQNDQVQAMVDGLARRLQEQPQNLPAWVMLARSYETLERYDDAAQAWRQALQEAQHSQMDAEVQAMLWADMADALASARGGSLDGEAGQAIAQALKLQPTQPKALALAGSAALRLGELGQARKHWQALLALLEPGSDLALRVQDDLLKLETLSQEGGQPVAAKAKVPETSPSRLSGELRWAAGQTTHTAQIQGTQAQVFVVVRADGHPRPVAVLRLPASALPTHFTLGPENLLDPSVALPAFAALRVQARLSLDGQAMPKNGDVYSPALVAAPGASALVLELGAVP
ncbi:c-type cytochrome biogenesis protein CcmI [Comamonas aquatilis]|uniref:c-type cytochrome biogenesis protein CcmI n=1 Tax=Comamonas aquatilis TaxID=1778406 RepID=UPI0039F02ADE